MTAAFAILVGDARADPLIGALAESLRLRSWGTDVIAPGELAAHDLAVSRYDATHRGRRIAAAVVRSSNWASLADAFNEEDRAFATSEVRALWLHILTLPSVRCVNRPDPATWFGLGDWTMWRRRFVDGGVDVAPIEIGDAEAETTGRWLMWGGGDAAAPDNATVRGIFGAAVVGTPLVKRSLWCSGAVVDGPNADAVTEAGRVLSAWDIGLAAIDTDDRGRVVSATVDPPITLTAARPTAERLATHLCS